MHVWTCLHIHRLRVCPTTTDPYSVLVLSVHIPDATRPVAVEVGLAGSGITARTILDSLRAGLATSAAAAAGVSEKAIAATTGHKSMTVLRAYIRAGSLFTENAAGAVGL